MRAEVTGEVETENKVLVIRRIHVVYRIAPAPGQGEVIERVHRMHAKYCPVYLSLYKAIDITTDYEIAEEESGMWEGPQRGDTLD